MFRLSACVVLSGLLLSPVVYAQQQKEKDPPAAKSDSKDQKPSDNTTQDKKSSNAEDNPFPEDVSRRAAEKANPDSSAPEAKPENPDAEKRPAADAGDSSESSSASRTSGVDWNTDPNDKNKKNGDLPDTGHDTQQALKDDEIGKFYLAKGEWRGAYNRFKDALAAEPEDADAAFGLAEAASKLKLTEEAVSGYQKYLELFPDGPKAKASVKALRNLEAPGKENSRK